MALLRRQEAHLIGFGHSNETVNRPKPHTQYGLINHLHGWHEVRKLLDRDEEIIDRTTEVLSRVSRQIFVEWLGHLMVDDKETDEATEGTFLNVSLNPAVFPRRFLGARVSGGQHEHPFEADSPVVRCFDIGGHRVYAAFCTPLDRMSADLGLSLRAGEQLLSHADGLKEVQIKVGEPLPPPTWTPEGTSHRALRIFIVDTLRRGALSPEGVRCTEKDVYLYPTGCLAIAHYHNILLRYRPGRIILLGIPHWRVSERLFPEIPSQWMTWWAADDQGMAHLELWLDREEEMGMHTSYVVVEFPSNLTLVSADLARLKKLSLRFGFVVVIDNSAGGMTNVDVLAHADLLHTTLSYSFSGYADVKGDSLVLNPASPHYETLAPRLASTFHNELFETDAKVLLSNAQDINGRTKIANENALALAEYVKASMSNGMSPVKSVIYPSFLPCKPHFDAVKRRKTKSLSPGYGFLLIINFESLDLAKTFYNFVTGFYSDPHIGGHVTTMYPYSLFVLGNTARLIEPFGIEEASIRISVGLEDKENLIETVRHALGAAMDEKAFWWDMIEKHCATVDKNEKKKAKKEKPKKTRRGRKK